MIVIKVILWLTAGICGSVMLFKELETHEDEWGIPEFNERYNRKHIPIYTLFLFTFIFFTFLGPVALISTLFFKIADVAGLTKTKKEQGIETPAPQSVKRKRRFSRYDTIK